MKTRIFYGAMIALLGIHAMADGDNKVSQTNHNGKNVINIICKSVYIQGQGEVCIDHPPLPNLMQQIRGSTTATPQPLQQPHYVAPQQPNSTVSTFYDASTGLRWQDNRDAKTVQRDWEGAKSYCANLTLDGYSDWRLPSKEELESIVDKSRTPTIKKEFKNTTNNWYWSASPSVYGDSLAWIVNFGNGYTGNGAKSDTDYVRCVRGRQ